jgi:hypothetical protein
MTRCKTGCLHRALVQDYYRERDAQAVRAEAVTGGYVAETAGYFGASGREERWTFKRWLVTHARRGYDLALAGLAGPPVAPAFVGAPLDTLPEV